MINETGVFFFPGGGHDHDGENSSLIDVTAYSIFDFEWSTSIGGPDRVRRLDRNYTAFREFIITTVNQSILNPAGIFYQPGSINGGSHIISDSITADQIAADTITANEIAANTITANEIAAGTITGDLLNANVVLVNQAILSNNYVPGVSGWAIDGDGTAEFDAASIRGTLTAAAVLTPGVDIYANGVLAASNFTMYANGAIANNNFSVDASGNLVATNAVITGQINATSGSISGNLIAGGTISGTSININSGTFQVSSSGALTASSANITGTVSSSNLTATGGSIGGWTVNGSSDLRNGNSTTILRPNGTIDMGGNLNASGTVNAGSGFSSSAGVSVQGDITTPNTVQGSYFIGSGTVADTGVSVVRRSDGYYLKQTSLRKYKDNIETIPDAMQIIDALSPRIFNWKPASMDPDNIHTQQIKYSHKNRGFIVEEVQAVSDELVHWEIDKIDGVESLNPVMWKTDDFIAIAIQGIKELKEVVSGLQTTVSALEQRIQQLENGV